MSSVGGVWGRGRHVGLEVESLVNNGIACVQEKVGGDLKGTGNWRGEGGTWGSATGRRSGCSGRLPCF